MKENIREILEELVIATFVQERDKELVDQALQDILAEVEGIIDIKALVKTQLPYPATFTLASPDGVINKITLSYEAAEVICAQMRERLKDV